MKLKFTKMHGAGNDFIVVNRRHRSAQSTSDAGPVGALLADRRFGIGADQILVVEKPSPAAGHAISATGFLTTMAAKSSSAATAPAPSSSSSSEPALDQRREISRVQTMNGVIEPRMEVGRQPLPSTWARPVLERAADVPFDAGRSAAAWRPGRRYCCGRWCWKWAARETPCCFPSSRWAIRTPCKWSTMSTAAPVVLETGPLIEHHPRFPKRVNAGFMQTAVDARPRAPARVRTRRAGETLACGTGACAAVVAGIRRGLLDSPGASRRPRRHS